MFNQGSMQMKGKGTTQSSIKWRNKQTMNEQRDARLSTQTDEYWKSTQGNYVMVLIECHVRQAISFPDFILNMRSFLQLDTVWSLQRHFWVNVMFNHLSWGQLLSSYHEYHALASVFAALYTHFRCLCQHTCAKHPADKVWLKCEWIWRSPKTFLRTCAIADCWWIF